MTKVIAVLLIVVVIYGGWELFLYWEKVKNEEETKQKQEEAAMVVGDRLPGLPYKLEQSLQTARTKGAAGLKNWLKTYGQSVEDPRKAWQLVPDHHRRRVLLLFGLFLVTDLIPVQEDLPPDVERHNDSERCNYFSHDSSIRSMRAPSCRSLPSIFS